ncbi:MAG: replication-associated recombination protein A [Candidatus Omnitrophica bacterium]|nr:replication-associated recombination protein A [Candidatus Omnitrophota bacterium]
MRPRSLADFVGQYHILGEGCLLRRLIDADRVSSLILYGPPGTGKSCLALLISTLTKAHFEMVNAAISGVPDLKKLLERAKQRRDIMAQRTIAFVDEIHRFNKAQQDVLLPDVEQGTIILIGATTHNPFFYVIPALISRSQIFELKPHAEADVLRILEQALADRERGLGQFAVQADPEALRHLCRVSDGDARRALNALEVGVLSTPPAADGLIHFSVAVAEESIQKKVMRYDRGGDDHYDTISAFIKSMRGSDPDAAVYWLAKMIYAGEDARFIARRIVICAAEDVGNADPHALMLATAAFQTVELIGFPEARIPLAQAAIYVACAPKSNASYLAIEAAAQDVASEPSREVPQHLKNASYKGAKTLERGKGYQYAHDFEQHYVKQEYMPRKKIYFQPSAMGYEKNIGAWLSRLRKE